MNLVRIYHPHLPGQHSDVPESAVPHWSRSGWSTEKPEWVVWQEQEEQAAREQAEKEVKSETKSEAPETSGASSSETRRGRRQSKEGES